LKILHLSPSFFPATYYGGPIRSGYAMCTELAKAGCDVRVLTTNSNGPRVLPTPPGKEVTIDGIRILYCRRTMQPDIAPSILTRLPAFLGWADVVHVTGVFSCTTLPGLAGAALYRKPVVLTPRGSLMNYGLSRKRPLKRAWLAACNRLGPERIALHVTSELEQEHAAAALPGSSIKLIANGVDIPENIVRPQPGETLRLLFIGRLDPAKGLENLLHACALQPNATLTIGGDGEREYVRSLHRLTGELRLRDRVTFAGEVLGSVKRQLLDSSDVFVMASHSENFGMSIAEALAHGLPVIASRGTPWQRIEEIGCGIWTDNSPASLAAAIGRIGHMPLLEMGARGRAWIQREFTWEPRAQAMVALYRELTKPSWQPTATERSAA
jgi:glycosyltransferase involved in cell wall biosynthesis